MVGGRVRRPSVIVKADWDKLSEKQQRIVAFMAKHILERFSTRSIAEGAGLKSVEGVDLTKLNIKFQKLGVVVRVSWEDVGQQTFWFMS